MFQNRGLPTVYVNIATAFNRMFAKINQPTGEIYSFRNGAGTQNRVLQLLGKPLDARSGVDHITNSRILMGWRRADMANHDFTAV